MKIIYILYCVLLIVAHVKPQETDLAEPPEEEVPATVAQEDIEANEIATDPSTMDDATEPAVIEDSSLNDEDLPDDSEMSETSSVAPTDSAPGDNAPLPTEDIPSENPSVTEAPPNEIIEPSLSESSSPETPSVPPTVPIETTNPPHTDTTPPTLIPGFPDPSITISLPTFWPSTIFSNNSLDVTLAPATPLCKENEAYSCIPFCTKTCINPISKFLCRPLSNNFRFCRRGCVCKSGYLLEKPNGNCVNECPRKQLF